MTAELIPVTIKHYGVEHVAEISAHGMIVRGFGRTQEEAFKDLAGSHSGNTPAPPSNQ